MSRNAFLPFHSPDIGDDEISAVVETLRSGWLTTGPRVRAFEQAFADYVGLLTRSQSIHALQRFIWRSRRSDSRKVTRSWFQP